MGIAIFVLSVANLLHLYVSNEKNKDNLFFIFSHYSKRIRNVFYSGKSIVLFNGINLFYNGEVTGNICCSICIFSLINWIPSLLWGRDRLIWRGTVLLMRYSEIAKVIYF